MAIYRNEGRYDSSNVEYAAGEILAYSKTHRIGRMHYIDYGVAMLHTSTLDALPDGRPCDLADLYADLLSQGQLAAYEVAERFYEIGSVAGLAQTREFLLGRAPPHERLSGLRP
jgi:NDP-sugar pyrophosphorylase family protein